MVKTQSLKYVLCLLCSVIVNIIFVFKEGGEWNLSWSRIAAIEAEAVAAISCSGHGRAYLDGLVLDGNKEPVCECNTCYGGPDCSQFLPDCAADANGYVPISFYCSLGHVKYYILGYDGRGSSLSADSIAAEKRNLMD
ncbi:hypothetical protein DKX38_008251 [Salix brachista]|uniref:Alliinase EGF-like domain-containing protein n=1 Tax=Salix brachista TaxID=2182728 RepID=A0A5N5MQR2_9ROSI|nr:hypothetical protein DKX38_008251 [Salix brachista]